MSNPTSITQLFDDVLQGLQAVDLRMNMTEDDQHIRISVELPGVDPADVEVSATREEVLLKGHKHEETEEKGRNYYRMERSFGSFERRIPLPVTVRPDEVQAAFKKGVLSITLPKSGDARKAIRKIDVQTES